MIGPFMQGLLLIGIIYWYSKSMMSMINDYYRNEFQRKLQAAGDVQPAAETPLNVDNFMDYVRELETKEQPERIASKRALKISGNSYAEPSYMLLHFLHITGAYKTFDYCGVQHNAADSCIS